MPFGHGGNSYNLIAFESPALAVATVIMGGGYDIDFFAPLLQGVKLINIKEGDSIAAVSVVDGIDNADNETAEGAETQSAQEQENNNN